MLDNLKKLFSFQVSINNRTAKGKNIDMENTSITEGNYYKGRSEVYEKWVMSLITSGEPPGDKKQNRSPQFFLNNNIPCWRKDLEGRLVYISPGYERVFLDGFNKTADDYLGKTDVEFWGEKIGSVYRANDARAFFEHELWIGIVPCAVRPDVMIDFKIIKWKEYTPAGNYLGIAGLAIPARRVKDLVNGSEIS